MVSASRTDFLNLVTKTPFCPAPAIRSSPEKTAETKPDYVPVLRWNLRDEMILSALILAAETPI